MIFLSVCFTLALCGEYNNEPLRERRDPTDEELNDADVVVLDVGEKAPALNLVTLIIISLIVMMILLVALTLLLKKTWTFMNKQALDFVG